MAVINGADMLMYIDGTGANNAIGYATSHTLNISNATRDVSNKNSGQYEQFEYGRTSVSATAEGLAVYDDYYNFEKLMDLVNDRTSVVLYFGKKTSDANLALTGSEFYSSGSFIIESLDLNAADQDNVTYSANFKLNGNFYLTNVPT